MPMPSLDDVGICDTTFRTLACGGKKAEAEKRANSQLAMALNDVAVSHLMNNRRAEAISILRQAANVAPDEQLVFHNLLSTLNGQNQLRGHELLQLKHRVLDLQKQVGWAKDYRPLLFLPQFLNLEFVEGKCNLHCRMCVGVQDERYPNKFTSIPIDAFEKILESAPTIQGMTLSSGNSDPLLHPHIERVIQLAAEKKVDVDIYTNGHPLTEARARLFVESGAVKMLNVSLDGATPETYRRIRGADLARVLKNIERLQQIKAERGAKTPWLSLSMVAMADNIHELPDFVRMAIRLGAGRVNLEDLIGWQDRPSDNRKAAEHPDCAALLREALAIAADAKMTVFVPEGLRAVLEAPGRAKTVSLPVAADTTSPADKKINSCSWVEGLYVDGKGKISTCCMVHDVADMGTVHDGPLQNNTKYNRVKELLFSGKVFRECNGQPCEFVQQQARLGVPLQYITNEELGDLAPKRNVPAATIQLTVNGRPSNALATTAA